MAIMASTQAATPKTIVCTALALGDDLGKSCVGATETIGVSVSTPELDPASRGCNIDNGSNIKSDTICNNSQTVGISSIGRQLGGYLLKYTRPSPGVIAVPHCAWCRRGRLASSLSAGAV